MFVNKDFLDYEYLVEVSDNYVVLTNQRNVTADWENPEEIDVIYQYIKPSTETIETTKNYTSNKTFTRIEVSDNYWDRADSIELVRTEMCILFFIIFIINGLTRFVRKGGIFFGQ